MRVLLQVHFQLAFILLVGGIPVKVHVVGVGRVWYCSEGQGAFLSQVHGDQESVGAGNTCWLILCCVDLEETTGQRQPTMRHLLLHAQAWWDAQRFDQPAWQVAAWRDQKVRHIHLHVAKALGKVVAALGAEARTASSTDLRARVRDEVLPDVAIYRSQLLNLFPDACASLSLSHCIAGGGAPEAEPLLRVVLGLSRASAQLAVYLEP